MKLRVIPVCLVVLGGMAFASAAVAAQPGQLTVTAAQAAGTEAMPPISAAPTSPTPRTAPIVSPRHLTQAQMSPPATPPGGHGGPGGDDTAMRAMYIAMGAMTGFMVAAMPVTATSVTAAVGAGIVTMWAYDYVAYSMMPMY